MAWSRPLVQLWLEWKHGGLYTCYVETEEKESERVTWRRETLKVSRTEVHLLSAHSGVSLAYRVCTWGGGASAHLEVWYGASNPSVSWSGFSSDCPDWLKGATPTFKVKPSPCLEAAAVISEGNCNDVGAVGSASDLTGSVGQLIRLILVTVGFWPQLLMKILHHPLQVLPGLPFLQQVSTQLLAVSVGLLQLHLEVLYLEIRRNFTFILTELWWRETSVLQLTGALPDLQELCTPEGRARLFLGYR